MDFTKKNISFIIILGILFYGLAVITITVCASNCTANARGFDLPKDVSCAVSHHSFVANGIELSVLFALPFVGIFIVKGRLFIATGTPLYLFRPPRVLF
jgi:hypothetical protein